jgi:hypothetical protein
MPPKISITLPSIYPDALQRCLAGIKSATRNTYEVLVVSPFRVDEPNVVWIEETERRGCAFAHDVASRRATGEFITAFADDWLYADGWDETVLPDFIDREKRAQGKYLMGLRYDHYDLVGTVFGIYYANFPFVRRSNLDRYGWIGPDYRLGFGDADLSLRVWHRGGRCEFSVEKVLRVTSEDATRKDTVALFSPEDFALFVATWAPIYGKGIRTDNLRDFNIDVAPEGLKGCLQERTIYGNNRKFIRNMISQGPPFLVETVNAVNIVSFQGLFYAIPQAIGPIDLSDSDQRKRPGISFYNSLADARTANDPQTYPKKTFFFRFLNGF